MNDNPVDLDKHRGMAAQEATDIRRVLADVESKAKLPRNHKGVVEIQLLSAPATSWPEAAAKARYVLNLYAAGSAPEDMHHRDLMAAIMWTLPGSRMWPETLCVGEILQSSIDGCIGRTSNRRYPNAGSHSAPRQN